MPIERRNISTTKMMETPGFIIYGDIESADEEPKQPPVPTVPREPVPDAKWSASCRIECQTHLMEPVYEDGNPSGEWRVFIFKTPRANNYLSPLKVNWHRQFETKEAADEWVKLALKYLENRKS